MTTVTRKEVDAGTDAGLDAGPPVCTSAADVCTLFTETYDRVACDFRSPNCPPFGLDMSTCGPLIEAALTCEGVQEALLLCRRCT